VSTIPRSAILTRSVTCPEVLEQREDLTKPGRRPANTPLLRTRRVDSAAMDPRIRLVRLPRSVTASRRMNSSETPLLSEYYGRSLKSP